MTHKIMVVDDNSATRRMVKNALVRNGHQVIEAPDGRTARELMVKEHPRVVLQDLMLPDADGFELVGQLRDLAGSDVSILAFSGFVSKLDEARASTVGFDDIMGSAHFIPPLTTVRQGFTALGRRCLEMLRSAMASEELDHTPVVPCLVIRASSGPAPG